MLSVNVLNNFDYGDVIDKKNFYTSCLRSAHTSYPWAFRKLTLYAA